MLGASLMKRAGFSMCTQTAQSQTKNDENRYLELRFLKIVHKQCAFWVHMILVRTWENKAFIWFYMTP